MMAQDKSKATPGPWRKRITVGDLRPGDNGAGKPFLYCPSCGGRWSADARDYWAASDDTVLRCSEGHRARNMVRLREQRTYEVA